LAGISNAGLSASQFSNFQFTTTPENFISAIAETSDQPTVYPGTAAQTASYNNLNQLTNLSGQPLSYDLDGNLLSDGQRNYTWDAENRLVGITYPAQPGKQTAFAYDGLGRRTAIASTPAGGSPVTTSYVWCGERLCQARAGGNSPTRSYYDEGEFVPGSPAQSLYYGPDQIGSVRRVFASASSAPAYGYDPYGNALQGTAPLTDFNYAGMFYNADSGLYLTQYRAYDPVAGRWLSRDALGEMSDPAANLYRYVNGNPVSLIDPDGRFGLAGAAVGAVVGGAVVGLGDLAWQLHRNGGNLRCVNPRELAGAAAAGVGIGALIGGTAGFGLLAGEAGELLPTTLARVIPADIPATTLGAPGAADVFVTTPEALEGLDAAGIAQKLSIPESPSGFNIIRFATPEEGLASPVFRTNPGFVGGGYTAGGAPEFVVPNGPIPSGATFTTVP
jgi:RHS repeat-associated protein